MHQLRVDQRLQLSYEHVQSSPSWLRLLAPVVVTVVLVVTALGGANAVVISLLAVALVLAAFVSFVFGRLTVTVSSIDSAVSAAFGFGWPRRDIDLRNVTAIAQVRNRWWYGWGLRWIPGGSMYNVWGLDAIELRLGNERVFRIGTDDPAELRVALVAARSRVRDR